jgi:hypothetical protein
MAFPVGTAPGQRWEIEFTAGTWTDISADVEYTYAPAPVIHHGRTDRYSQPGPGSMTFTLRNETGKYTPFRQVLTNGQAHPYWPNVVPRKRVRYSYTVAGTQYIRFVGYVKGWPPAMESGVRPYVTVTATTRDDQLSRVKMNPPIRQEITPDAPFLWWPLTDDAGSTQAAPAPPLRLYPLGVADVGAAVTFGDNGPGVGDGTGVKFTPGSSSSGQYLQSGPIDLGSSNNFTIELWVNCAAIPAWGAQVALGADNATNSWGLSFGLSAAGLPSVNWGGVSVAGATSIVDGGWHHLAASASITGLGHLTFYVDGVSAGTSAGVVIVSGRVLTFAVGEDYLPNKLSPTPKRFQGNVGEVAVYSSSLSAARIAAHAAATNGYSGDTTDARAARYLGVAGLTASDWTLDAGQTTVGTYPQAGKDTISACQDMATTEGGVFWFRWDGKARFASRRYRDATTPALTLDALVDLDATVYDPAYDETTLVNSSTVSRSAESGVLSTQTYTDTTSLTAYGESDADITTYTLSDQDALNLAQAQVAGNSQPGFRLNRVAANLHASTVSKYAALGVVEIGSRSRIINLPAGAAPLGTLDGFVEGWTEYPAPTTYRVEFDWSPIGPPRWKWGTSRWQCDGQTLNTALTPSATTVIIDTAAGKPTFTTTAGMYPMNIQIGQEIIQLNSAPAGSTSPQTFTGVSRAQQGTPAAAQAVGATVSLWPADTWAL